MIVYRYWQKKDKCRPNIVSHWEGWFLFGFIPLYVGQR
jgi:hypothetical protein